MAYSTSIFASDSLKISKPKVHFLLAENIGKAVANQPSFPSVKASQLTEFSILRQCNGAERWHQYYNFPETGVTFLFGTLGNQKVLGNVFATFATINFEKKSSKKINPTTAKGSFIVKNFVEHELIASPQAQLHDAEHYSALSSLKKRVGQSP